MPLSNQKNGSDGDFDKSESLASRSQGRSPLPRFSPARRRFLKTSAAAASGLALANCARNLSNANSGSSPTATGSPASSPSPAGGSASELYIYTWAGYTDDALIEGFREKTGIQVVVDLYDSNEAMMAKMQAGGGSAYSIIYPSDYTVIEMVKSGMLTSLDKSRVEGLDALKPKWQNPVYDRGNAHSIPTIWGTTGLIYDPQKVGKSIDGWNYIWDNRKNLTRKVTLINDVREVLGATLRTLGYSYNTTNPDQIKKAFNKLVQIKPAIASFLTTGWEDQLASGDITVSMAYSQDAIALIDEKPNLKYIVPQTGSSVWTDTMVIPKSAPNPEAAYAWINYLLQPEIAAEMVKQLGIATPSQAAFDLLPQEIQKDVRRFPTEATLSKCEGIAPVPEKITEVYDQYWTRLTSS
ncbi:MAG: spermidine/putrescine ABC transporter substrate-binding protein [Oscillatoriophycideae cyanobacterium NC_groundwater_1537_Pr4_S-0.65um_50_18]|nr:spermidine/putrescine ABC transporter substrate-binding protein [Oscillatoriophycideae cyanobacterium NC_groundwater_1537_Pr4_S-0.65um_50_18]